jgi:uncharacterized YccA/Bax inhibitor family protein
MAAGWLNRPVWRSPVSWIFRQEVPTMANPLFTDAAFQRVGGTGSLDAPPPPPGFSPVGAPSAPSAPVAERRTGTMTIGGTCSATGVMLVVLVIGAWFGWMQVTETSVQTTRGLSKTAELDSPGWLVVGLLVALGFAFLTAFKPPLAKFTALPYAIAEGYVIGAISHLYDVQTKGIVIQAVIATVGVFAVMLLLYGLRILRATPKFTKGVIAATFGVAAIYLVGFLLQLFGSDIDIFGSTSLLSIGFSLLVVGIAAMNLILDFSFIERGTAEGLSKDMEWYGAFGLVVTIVWLYLELLRLLSKLDRR